MLLKKALYGTKQAAHAWQTFLAGIFCEMGAKRHVKDDCVYIFQEGDGFVFIGTHVDDLFPLCNPEGKGLRDKILRGLESRMQIENKGTLSFALDTKIERDAKRGILKISQRAYIENLVEEMGVENSLGRETPSSGQELCEEDLPQTEEEKREVEGLG